VIEQALSVANLVLITVGSANAPRRHDFLPFTAAEREQMVRLMFSAEDNLRLRFAYVEDQGNMPRWTSLIREAANAIAPDNTDITLIGHSKDRSSFYLKAFPGWDSIEVGNFGGLSATNFRSAYFSSDAVVCEDLNFDGIDDNVAEWLKDFWTTDAYEELAAEAAKCANDVKTYGRIDPETGEKVYGPYLAADAIIIQGDQVLMIERGGHPYRGCLAFPGGFVEADEDVVDAAIRETVEETGLKVPEMVMRRSYLGTETFSAPHRDPRGRVVSFASLFHLNPSPPASMTDPKEIEKFLALPRVKGSDDARKAFWTPISKLDRSQMAFDHYSVLQKMLEKLPKE
jgi:bifunctional NMN adenylyltransferase/nudix hydrolase